ncbi:hypothetical protein [Novosphingobium nitrogenifigens]|nr:hypothetical protein [Novosphingobium nitrogenifigens]
MTSERLTRLRRRQATPVADATLQAPHHHVHPGARELRSQGIHRLQVGIFGLAAMLLLVSLASVIMDRVQTADQGVVVSGPSATGTASPAAANDPLADLGVAPEVPVNGDSANKQAKPAH